MNNFIYITTNEINGKQYIGSHNGSNKYYFGSGILIKKALKKYGRKNFHLEILEEFDNIEDARKSEEKYINEYNTLEPNGYNISPKGGLSLYGCHSQKTKEKIGNALRGKKRTKDQRLLMSKRATERTINGRQMYFSDLEEFTIIRLHLMMKQSACKISNFMNIGRSRIEKFLKDRNLYESHPNRSIQNNYINMVFNKMNYE